VQKHHHATHARNQAQSKRKRSRRLKRESSFDLLCGMHAHSYLQTLLNERKKRLRNCRHVQMILRLHANILTAATSLLKKTTIECNYQRGRTRTRRTIKRHRNRAQTQAPPGIGEDITLFGADCVRAERPDLVSLLSYSPSLLLLNFIVRSLHTDRYPSGGWPCYAILTLSEIVTVDDGQRSSVQRN
jgi:hypothetical protein